ncbi:helix-turn-helix domain-containing protein [Pseudorhodoplanes sinuspersici]|uniref:Uncharacterized protein n=1 Tax=Pseudorhodoplanes sinuspersici TaxID=1235591 RepID=A0A1W6ZKK9_9HYPH|nr:hypothetical protein CAK95_01430 [Pseudorhodoplanes sinuspersici]RKE68373.1 excisionase family DNA binding protein [Pseudorhodoplanes sinuspersici]
MISNPSGKLLKTIYEAAAELNVGRSTIYQLINQKELEVVKIGRCTRIPSETIGRYVTRLRQNGQDAA